MTASSGDGCGGRTGWWRHPALPAALALQRRALPDNWVSLAPAALGVLDTHEPGAERERGKPCVSPGPGFSLQWGGSARGGREQGCG